MTTERYLLDTNIVTYLYQKSFPMHSIVKKHLLSLPHDHEVYVSVLSIYELEYGTSVTENDDIKDMFSKLKTSVRQDFPILPLPADGSEVFGFLKAQYAKHTGITKDAAKRHDIDFMLAASAISEKAVMVSNDRIFEQMKKIYPGFSYENWAVG
jgi:predicted nucleic acid-binding protein